MVATIRVMASPQVRIAPGPLARAHAALEGVANCSKCHDAGQELSPAKCLTCHKPIADRIARKVGVHRAVTGDCNACHVEHRGADAELRQIDTQHFNHAVETGFVTREQARETRRELQRLPQEARPFWTCGRRAAPATRTCTRARSARTARNATRREVVFKDARTAFNHARAAFQLTGSHQRVACEKCHAAGVFRGLRFDTCSSCHKAPHRNELGPSCTSCHTTESWTTRTIEHGTDRLRARRRAPATGLREVPHLRREDGAPLRHVLGLPRERAPRQREGRLPQVPHRDELQGREVRSRSAHGVCARRQTRTARVQEVPHGHRQPTTCRWRER